MKVKEEKTDRYREMRMMMTMELMKLEEKEEEEKKVMMMGMFDESQFELLRYPRPSPSILIKHINLDSLNIP